MNEAQPPTPTYLDVTRTPDGRYCVAVTRDGVSRRSYTPSLEQVITQARRLSHLAVRTDDLAVRQRCQESGIQLIDLSVEEV